MVELNLDEIVKAMAYKKKDNEFIIYIRTAVAVVLKREMGLSQVELTRLLNRHDRTTVHHYLRSHGDWIDAQDRPLYKCVFDAVSGLRAELVNFVIHNSMAAAYEVHQ
jgi:hypothetical protein